MNPPQKQRPIAARSVKNTFASVVRILLVSLFLGSALGIFLESAHAEWWVDNGPASARLGGPKKYGPFATQQEAKAMIDANAGYGMTLIPGGSDNAPTATPSAASGQEMVKPIGDAIEAGLSGKISGSDAVGLVGAGIVAQGLINMLKGNSGNDAAAAARAARQAAIVAQQAAECQRQADAEAMRRLELAKQRILGALMGAESSGKLGLMLDSDQPLEVTRVQSAFGSTAIVPVGRGDAPTIGGLQLMLGDDAEKSSAQARQGFDTAGKIMGADLPAPPPSPKVISIAKLERINTLKADLKKNEDEEKLLKALLEKLKQSPTPDDSAIKAAEQIITAKEDDKKKIEKKILDLTAEDDIAGTPGDKPNQP